MSIISEKLEDIRNYLDVEVHPVVSPDRWDVYSALCEMVDDIIALLKAQEPISFEGTYLNREDYVNIGDIIDCLSEITLTDDAAIHAVGLIEWAMGKRAVTKEDLLKEREPKVIRLQDAEAMRMCWIETRHPHTTRPARIIRYFDDSPNVTIFSIHQNPTDWPVCEFGIEWRCWDKEPTNEQMEAVKWDE